MTYDAGNLHGAWENLDEDSVLTLNAGGDFRLTPPSDDLVSDALRISVVGDISGKWEVRHVLPIQTCGSKARMELSLNSGRDYAPGSASGLFSRW